jgi:hypothetical protein
MPESPDVDQIARQTFWLSFTDPSRPTGAQFLGVAVVDVTAADRDAAVPFVLARRPPGSARPDLKNLDRALKTLDR